MNHLCLRRLLASFLLLTLGFSDASAQASPAWPNAARIARSGDAEARIMTDVGGTIAGSTTWTRAGSPYVVTSDIVVPAGVTLSIEPGVVVQVGNRMNLTIEGSLRALGEAGNPINFKASAGEWGSLIFDAGSRGSQVAHGVFSGGGARRRPMVDIGASDLVISNSQFLECSGYAMRVREGAAPEIRESRFQGAANATVIPAAALQIEGGADPRLSNNYFLSNIYAVYMDASANPRMSGNRFDYNGHDGVMVYGDVKRDVRLTSLGPRRWSYLVDNQGITVQAEGVLTIASGTTLRFQPGQGIRVLGALRIQGAASAKVQLRPNSDDPRPGQWRHIRFEPSSQDYDPASGNGSIIDHAEVLDSGSLIAAIVVDRSAPMISNSVVAGSSTTGIAVLGAEATPKLVGNLIRDNRNEQRGSGLFVDDNAAPEASFNIFRGNLEGVRAESGSSPRIGPHNWFDFNDIYGVINTDGLNCVDATSNDWGDAAGPIDDSAIVDACGLDDYPGNGELVSDNVNYLPFEGQQLRPVLTGPRCGVFSDPQLEITGAAVPGSKVLVYDNHTLIGETVAEAGAGLVTPFRFRPSSPLGAGSHVIQIRSQDPNDPDRSSGITNPLEFSIDPGLMVDPANLKLSYSLEGIDYVQPFQDESGCLSLRGDGEWAMRVHPEQAGRTQPITLHVPIQCDTGGAPAGEVRYLDKAHPLRAGAGGLYEATFDLGEGGAVELTANCGNERRDFLLGTVTVEYNGFIYDASKNTDQRIGGAKVSLFARDPGAPAGQQWKLWQAQAHHGQTNPQITGPFGWYGFYPPPGQYRALVEAEGFQSAIFSLEDITTEAFMQTIGLSPATGAIYMPALYKAHGR